MESDYERVSSPGTERILGLFYDSEINSTSSSVTTSPKRRIRTQAQSNIMGQKDPAHTPIRDELVSMKIKDMHFAGDMIRRTVYNSQNAKEQKQGESLSSINELEVRTSNRQMKGLQQSQSMQTIIQEVMVVHNSITDVVKDLYHRKDLGSKVENANKAYIALFERMLSEVLLLQRSKFNIQIKSVEELSSEITFLKKKVEDTKNQLEYVTGKVSSLSHQVKELSVLNNSSSLEIIELNDQLILLENMKKDYINSLLETKKAYKIHNEKKIEIEKKIIADDKIYRLKEMADIRQQWIRDQTLDRDHDLFKQQRAIEFALTDNQNKKNNLKLKEVLAKTTDFKYPKRDNCSQTDINDDGFWDVRKGWTLPVSGCIIARNRWREAFKFSTCKSCRGVGGYVAKAVLLYKELINKNSVLYDKIDEKKDECNKDDSISHRNSSSQFIIKNNNNSNNDNNNNNDDNNNIENNINNNNANNNNNNDHNIKIINDDLRRSSSSVVSSTFLSTSTSTSTYQTAATMRRQAAIVAATMVDTKHRLIWKIPDLLSSFLSNLPINLCGITPYNRSWVIRQLYQILNLKLTNDKMDSDMGTGVQDCMTFLIENFLLNSTRQAAEIDLYRLVMSIKEIFMHHPLVHTFARLFSLCDGNLQSREFLTIDSTKKKYGTDVHPESNVRHSSNAKGLGKYGSSGSGADNSLRNAKKLVLSDCAIPLPMCTVYLYVRSCLLKEYTGLYTYHITKVRENSRIQKSLIELLFNDAMEGNKKKKNNKMKSHKIEIINDQIDFNMNKCIDINKTKNRNIDEKIEVNKSNESKRKLIIPSHVFLDQNLFFYIPIDRALRVVSAIFNSADINNETQKVYFIQIELHAHVMNRSGFILERTGMVKQIHLLFRKLMKSKSVYGKDLSEEELYGLGENGSEIQYKKAEDEIIYMKNQMNILKEKNNFVNIINSNVNAIRSNTSSNKVNVNKKNNNDDNNMNNNNNNNTDNDTDDIKESKDKFEYSENEMRGAATSGFKGEEKLVMIVVDLDYILQIIIEVLLQKSLREESNLRKVYIDGDADGDGVLSFQEFQNIFKEVAPDWHERRIMNVFREALMMGKHNNSTIGPEAFATVCVRHGLLKLVDMSHLQNFSLSALSNFPIPRSVTPLTDIQKMELRKMENSKNNSSYRVQNSLEERTILSPMTDRLDSSRTSMQQRKQSSKLNYDRLPIITSNDGNSINNDIKNNKNNNHDNNNNNHNHLDRNECDENTKITINQKVEIKLRNQRNYNKLNKNRSQKTIQIIERSSASQTSRKSSEHSLNSSGGVSKVNLDLVIPGVFNNHHSLLSSVSIPRLIRSAKNVFSLESPKYSNFNNSINSSRSSGKNKIVENDESNNGNKGIIMGDKNDILSPKNTKNSSLTGEKSDRRISSLAGIGGDAINFISNLTEDALSLFSEKDNNITVYKKENSTHNDDDNSNNNHNNDNIDYNGNDHSNENSIKYYEVQNNHIYNNNDNNKKNENIMKIGKRTISMEKSKLASEFLMKQLKDKKNKRQGSFNENEILNYNDSSSQKNNENAIKNNIKYNIDNNIDNDSQTDFQHQNQFHTINYNMSSIVNNDKSYLNNIVNDDNDINIDNDGKNNDDEDDDDNENSENDNDHNNNDDDDNNNNNDNNNYNDYNHTNDSNNNNNNDNDNSNYNDYNNKTILNNDSETFSSARNHDCDDADDGFQMFLSRHSDDSNDGHDDNNCDNGSNNDNDSNDNTIINDNNDDK